MTGTGVRDFRLKATQLGGFLKRFGSFSEGVLFLPLSNMKPLWPNSSSALLNIKVCRYSIYWWDTLDCVHQRSDRLRQHDPVYFQNPTPVIDQNKKMRINQSKSDLKLKILEYVMLNKTAWLCCECWLIDWFDQSSASRILIKIDR